MRYELWVIVGLYLVALTAGERHRSHSHPHPHLSKSRSSRGKSKSHHSLSPLKPEPDKHEDTTATTATTSIDGAATVAPIDGIVTATSIDGATTSVARGSVLDNLDPAWFIDAILNQSIPYPTTNCAEVVIAGVVTCLDTATCYFYPDQSRIICYNTTTMRSQAAFTFPLAITSSFLQQGVGYVNDCGCVHGRCGNDFMDGRTRACLCYAGFSGPKCTQGIGVCSARADTCGLHGKCDDGRCVCRDGYTGPHCEYEPCLAQCSGRGMCYHTFSPSFSSSSSSPSVAPISTTGEREGEGGGVGEGYWKAECICFYGTYGPDCSLSGCGVYGAGECSGRGWCQATVSNHSHTPSFSSSSSPSSSSSSSPPSMLSLATRFQLTQDNEVGIGDGLTCRCLPGFAGPHCEHSVCGWCAHGRCETNHTSSPSPSSSSSSSPSWQCVCDGGWEGTHCDVMIGRCPGNPQCSAQGLCVDGSCECHPPFGGDDCSIDLELCPLACSGSERGECVKWGCRCQPGYTGRDCAISVCPMPCENGGLCAQGQCFCPPSFTGPTCAQRVCPNQCSGHGVCVDGVCHCILSTPAAPTLGIAPKRYFGDDCSKVHCDSDCGGPTRGVCDTTIGMCQCFDGTAHDSCARSACNMTCGPHGVCRDGRCLCDVGNGWTAWTGTTCGDPLCPNRCSGGGAVGEAARGYCGPSGCVCHYPYWTPDCSQKRCPIVARKGEILPQDDDRRDWRAHDDSGTGGKGAVADVDGWRRWERTMCSGHGVCMDGVCACRQGWKGLACETRACPNDCMGRGICREGLCVCLDGWTANDCSKPEQWGVGSRKPCPGNCSGIGLCVRGKCFCQAGKAHGPDCGLRYCPNDCSGKGQCNATHGVCACSPGWAGDDCSQPWCLVADCGGRGSCLLSPARKPFCKCDPPYTGDHCQNVYCEDRCSGHGQCINQTCYCDPMYTGNKCQIEKCPKECSTHGTCSVYSIVAHGREVGTGKQTGAEGCVCEPGWSGVDCSIGQCHPSPTCSSHGSCDGPAYGPPVCVCDPGYAGPACADVRCTDDCSFRGECLNGRCSCDPGFKGFHCELDVCPHNCSFNGRCATRANPLSWDGSAEGCVCDEGYMGDDCSIEKECDVPCVYGDCVGGRCVCNAGWRGHTCAISECQPHDCHGRGLCTGDIYGFPTCRCRPPFKGRDCLQVDCLAGCSGHGECVNSTCVCNPLYAGPICNITLSTVCPNACSGRGRCNTPTNPLAWVTLENDGCICDEAWTGPDCSQEKECSTYCGHGRCLDGKCVCDAGWGGTACSESLCSPPDCWGRGECGGDSFSRPQCQCHYPYSGTNCTQVPCPSDCSRHGVCLDSKCVCDPPWTGDLCQTAVCPNRCSLGNSQGFCNNPRFAFSFNSSLPTGCVCAPGWGAHDCSIPTCGEGCGKHGRCVGPSSPLHPYSASTFSPTPAPPFKSPRNGSASKEGLKKLVVSPVEPPLPAGPLCVCEDPYTGPHCTDILCSHPCSGRGKCLNFACQCDPGFTGVTCEKELCPKHCSGRGRCNSPGNPLAWHAPWGCVCEDGWTGPDCSIGLGCESGCEHGRCLPGAGLPMIDTAYHTLPLLHTPWPVGETDSLFSHRVGLCVCDAGWDGPSCNISKCTPPDCNGHGVCTEDVDGKPVCACRYPYFGPLCKQVECSSNCSLHGQCVDFQCHCEPRWQGDLCEQEVCPGNCNGHGSCNNPRFPYSHTWGHETGCICTKQWTGPDCLTPVCEKDCHGTEHGVCLVGNSGQPQCLCFPPFAGPACADRLCENKCSGHGLCVNFECQCERNWAGPNCDQPWCDDCGPGGECTLVNGTRVCVCRYPHTGHGCLNVLCDMDCGQGVCIDKQCWCKPGYRGHHCEREVCPSSCSGHGKCNNRMFPYSYDASREERCHCMQGWHGPACDTPVCHAPCVNGECLWDTHEEGEDEEKGMVHEGSPLVRGSLLYATAFQLPTCHCNPGWTGPTCAVAICSTNCSGHGKCHRDQCTCDQGFVGDHCHIEMCPNGCGAHGVCTPTMALKRKQRREVEGTTGGGGGEERQCVCHEGWWGPACQYEVGCESCGAHGLCVDSKCRCDAGWTGSDCTISECTPECVSGRGECGGDAFGFPTCHCFPPYAGPTCASVECMSGCGGHGNCVDGACICHPGFKPPDCTTPVCPNYCSGHGKCNSAQFEYSYNPSLEEGCICLPGWTGIDCSLAVCEPICINGGQCVENERGLHVCQCSLPFTGLACADVVCGDCSSHGTCLNGVCHCHDKWAGLHCEVELCPNDCSGNGKCNHQLVEYYRSRLSEASSACFCRHGFLPPDCSTRDCVCGRGGRCIEGRCTCDHGWTGLTCDTEVCPDDCSGHGICQESWCVCDEGWGGSSCSQRVVLCSANMDMAALSLVFVRAEGTRALCLAHGKCYPVSTSSRSTIEQGGSIRHVYNDRFSTPHTLSIRKEKDGVVSLSSSKSTTRPKKKKKHNKETSLPSTARRLLLSGSHGELAINHYHELQCTCDRGWTGELCLTSLCQHGCSGRGQCTLDSHDQPSCACETGYTGPECAHVQCHSDCGGNGSCVDYECKCEPGFLPPLCTASECQNECVFGNCVEGRCTCRTGYSGPRCDQAICPLGCGLHGVCGVDGTCSCKPPHSGPSCSQTLVSP